jgi:NAD(P)-dependent dehydrogenase (short-subunit alcohol dehydrogenase family)
MSEQSVKMVGWMRMARFVDKVVVVTGAARGIGFACAQRFAVEGATVCLADADEDRLEAAAAALAEAGYTVDAAAVDVSVEASVEAAITGFGERHGGIDVVHAHAGVLLPAAVGDETLDRWERTLSVNVTGVFLTVRAALPQLRRRGGGAIVLTGSTAGIVAEPEFLAYCTSKAAVNHMARQLALDLVGEGVRVNAVCPGWIDTAFNDQFTAAMSAAEVASAVSDLVPMGRQGSAGEVAAAVAFLASDDASYITGHALVVDGGITIR